MFLNAGRNGRNKHCFPAELSESEGHQDGRDIRLCIGIGPTDRDAEFAGACTPWLRTERTGSRISGVRWITSASASSGPAPSIAILGLVCLAAVLAPVRLTPNGSPINVDRQNRSSGTNSEETGIPLVRLSLAIEPLGPNEIAASPLPPVALAGELMRADDRSGEEPHGGN